MLLGHCRPDFLAVTASWSESSQIQYGFALISKGFERQTKLERGLVLGVMAKEAGAGY